MTYREENRALRHNARDGITAASQALEGEPGLSLTTQRDRFKAARESLLDALLACHQAIALVNDEITKVNAPYVSPFAYDEGDDDDDDDEGEDDGPTVGVLELNGPEELAEFLRTLFGGIIKK